MIDSIEVINDVIIFDHRPLSFRMLCAVADIGNNDNMTHTVNRSDLRVPMWNKCDQYTLDVYANSIDVLLQRVNIPLLACDSSTCYVDIDKYYHDIMSCITNAIALCVPSRRPVVSDYNVPGWNTYADEKHEAARKAYLCWIEAGKPKFGYYFDCMTRTRAVFKLALRYCKQHEEELKVNACAESLFDSDPRKFWNNVYKLSNSELHVRSAASVDHLAHKM